MSYWCQWLKSNANFIARTTSLASNKQIVALDFPKRQQ